MNPILIWAFWLGSIFFSDIVGSKLKGVSKTSPYLLYPKILTILLSIEQRTISQYKLPRTWTEGEGNGVEINLRASKRRKLRDRRQGSWLLHMHLAIKRYLIISDHHLSLNYEASSTNIPLSRLITSTLFEQLSRVWVVKVLVMAKNS